MWNKIRQPWWREEQGLQPTNAVAFRRGWSLWWMQPEEASWRRWRLRWDPLIIIIIKHQASALLVLPISSWQHPTWRHYMRKPSPRDGEGLAQIGTWDWHPVHVNDRVEPPAMLKSVGHLPSILHLHPQLFFLILPSTPDLECPQDRLWILIKEKVFCIRKEKHTLGKKKQWRKRWKQPKWPPTDDG